MSETSNTRHGANPHAGDVHLDIAEYVQLGAPAGVQVLVVLHHLDGGLHGVQDVPGLSEDPMAGSNSCLNSIQFALVILRGHHDRGGGGARRHNHIPMDCLAAGWQGQK